MNKHNQYLVIGGGVGGLFISYHLLKEGHKVTLIDRGTNKSSVVAAGIMNPLVFRRMTKSWRVDELLPFACYTYRKLEEETGTSFFNPILIRRFFSSDQERNFWLEKQHLPEFTDYMGVLTQEDLAYDAFSLKNDFGSALVKNAYWVNASVFIESMRLLIAQHAEVITEQFDFSQLNPVRTVYRNKSYTGIIFSTGYENFDNPLFSFLPVQSTKGELLTVNSEQLPQEFSINRKCFVLPTGDEHFRIGATYVWDRRDAETSEEGKNEILEKLKVLTYTAPDIVDHQAGIRPTSPDRRPIIGRHPQFPGIFLFNGLGAKGYMIAPLLSKEFVNFVCNDTMITNDVNLLRFVK